MATKDMIKLVYDVLKEANRLDLAEEIVELRNNNLDLKEENLTQKQRILELTNQVELDDSIVFHEGVNWILNDSKTQGNEPTPICPRCWGVEKIVVRQKLQSYGSNGLGFNCQNCGKHFSKIGSLPKS